jgi:hypothetical protein
MNIKNNASIGFNLFIALLFSVVGPLTVALFLVESRGWFQAILETRFIVYLQFLLAIVMLKFADSRRIRLAMLIGCTTAILAFAWCVLTQAGLEAIVLSSSLAFTLVGAGALGNVAIWLCSLKPLPQETAKAKIVLPPTDKCNWKN